MTTTLPTNNNNNTPVQPDGMYNFRDLSLFFSNIKPGLMYRSENYLFASDKGGKEFVGIVHLIDKGICHGHHDYRRMHQLRCM